jgi:hypothetical protein
MNWTATIEYGAHVPDYAHDKAADHLIGHHGVVSTAPNGNFTITLSIQASTSEHALPKALEVSDRAVKAAHGRAAIVGIELLTEEEFDRRNAEPARAPELVGRMEVAGILDVDPRRAGQIIHTKKFRDIAPAVAELAAGPVFAAWQVRLFAEKWSSLPGPKPKRAVHEEPSGRPCEVEERKAS